jgi:DNA-binding response OmpR family regulator
MSGTPSSQRSAACRERVAPRLLLAEDDDELRGLIARALRGAGIDVREARNGRELFEALVASVASNVGAAPPDVVVTDLRMPGLSGLDVLQAVHGLALRVPVVVITAFGDAETHGAATAAGATVVLDKPFAIRDLLAHVNDLLQRPE